MKIRHLRGISRLIWGIGEVARVLQISEGSAKVFCARNVRTGELLRLKRNVYILKERWAYLTPEERLQVGNLLQVPSYISLMTALSLYEVTTQIQPAFVESIALHRTKELSVGDVVFRYTKVAQPLYFGFVKRNGVFIATPEKALADCLYLASWQRYHLDWSSLTLERIKPKAMQTLLARYPERTKRLWKARWNS